MRALVALIVLAAGLAGCARPDAPSADVVATFYPLHFLAGRIAGDNVTTAALVPSGVEPHDWEPAPGDAVRLAGAKLVLRQGVGLEPWLDGLLSTAEASARVVETTAGLELATGDAHEGEEDPGHEEEGEPLDPHTWLDPVLFAQQAQAVEDALAETFPEHAASFRARGEALRADLDRLHGEYEAGLESCEVRVVIANHDAYGYLARRYDFEVVAISGLSPEAEPSSRDIARAVEAARANNISVIFFEELVSPRVAEVVAKEVGATTRVLSPVEGLDEEARARGEDYLTRMRDNLDGLREAMRCR